MKADEAFALLCLFFREACFSSVFLPGDWAERDVVPRSLSFSPFEERLERHSNPLLLRYRFSVLPTKLGAGHVVS